MTDLGLYLHIPFCVRKCRYCDFLSFSADASARRQYLAALRSEIRAAAASFGERPVGTVFIGGGTPSLLAAEELLGLLEEVGSAFHVLPDAEVTVEMNPGAAWTEDEMRLLMGRAPARPSGESALRMDPCAAHRNGIYVNRWSVGLQSAHDGELALLGRIHRFCDFEETYRNLRGAGAENVNADLMFGIPGQTSESWEETLRTVISFSPEHISAYSLIVEEGTPFFEEYESGRLDLPDEDTERAMAHRASEILEEGGYRQYEISNYAKPGYGSRHNIRYWKRQNYLGLGLGAASMIDNVRWRNTTDLAEYLDAFDASGATASPGQEEEESAEGHGTVLKKHRDDRKINCSGALQKIRCDRQVLTVEEQMEEFLFLGLRMRDGVSPDEFASQFGRTLLEEYGDVIRKYEEAGLLRITGRDGAGNRGQRLCLTPAGMDVSNVIFADFLHDK